MVMGWRHWTEEQDRQAIDLVARGASDAECIAAVGRNLQACKMRLNRQNIEIGPRRTRKKPMNRAAGLIVPDSVYEDAARRMSAPRSITALVMGDPAPGHSALDRKQMVER